MGGLPLFQWLHFGADKRPRQVNILLLGPTGTGKSSFVQQVTGQPVETGDGLLPCTKVCRLYRTTHKPTNTSFALIDTPGLADVSADNLDVLNTIGKFLFSSLSHSITIHGIFYFHRMPDRRVSGTARLNLELLQAICGRPFFTQVLFVTTMWDTIPSRQRLEFEEGVFAELVRLFTLMAVPGSRIVKLDIGKADRVLGQFLAEIGTRGRRRELLFAAQIKRGVLSETTAAKLIVNQAERRRIPSFGEDEDYPEKDPIQQTICVDGLCSCVVM